MHRPDKIIVIVEQTIEWQTPLCVCFVDFVKALDSIDRQTVWSILLHYGVPKKMVSIIHNYTRVFSAKTYIMEYSLINLKSPLPGVRQGCLLSPLLFIVVLDWVIRTAYPNSGKAIQWIIETKLEDLEFLDDLALLSHHLQDMQDKLQLY